MPKPDVSDQRIPEILNAAAKVSSELGIDKASMALIAKEAGLSKATIYHYFTNKDEMVEALVRQLFDVDTAGLHRLTRDDRSAVERLLSYTENLGVLLVENQDLYPIFTECKAVSLRNPRINSILSHYYKGYVANFSIIFQQGVDSDEFSSELKVDDMALALASLIEGTILLSQNLNVKLPEMLCRCVSAFLNSLQK